MDKASPGPEPSKLSVFQRIQRDPKTPLALITAVALLVHLPNLLNYPAWFFDEGAYLTFSNQWQKTGQLTYYGHPFGALAILAILFAVANPTGYLIPRILMVVFSAADGVLLYKIAKLAYSRTEAFPLVASMIYVATPLSARYLRLVVVDNFMALFLLLSLLLIMSKPRAQVYSALLYGGALVSKQTALFFLPALLIVFWRQKKPISQIILWLMFSALIPLIWAIYGVYEIGFSGLLSSQFGLTGLGGERAVNAVTLIIQRITSRDPFIFLGLAGILWAIYKRDSIVAFPIAYLASFVILFLKISTVYLIPALPFFSILGAILLFDLLDRLPRISAIPRLRTVLFGIIILSLIISSLVLVIPQNPAVAQQDAVTYLAGQDSPSVIVSYTYMWIFQQNYPRITIYDRYSVPWNQLTNKTIYLIVDFPGDLVTINGIPQYHQLYTSNQTTIVWNETISGYTVQVLRGTVP